MPKRKCKKKKKKIINEWAMGMRLSLSKLEFLACGVCACLMKAIHMRKNANSKFSFLFSTVFVVCSRSFYIVFSILGLIFWYKNHSVAIGWYLAFWLPSFSVPWSFEACKTSYMFDWTTKTTKIFVSFFVKIFLFVINIG